MEETPRQRLMAIAGGLALLAGAYLVARHVGDNVNDIVRHGVLVPATVTDVALVCRHGSKTVEYDYRVDGIPHHGASELPCDEPVPAHPEVAYLPASPDESVIMDPARYADRAAP